MIDRLTERWLDARRLVKEVNSRPNLAVVLMAASFLMRAGRQAFIVFGSHWYSGRTKDSSEYRNLITEEKSVKRSKEEKSMKETGSWRKGYALRKIDRQMDKITKKP